MLPSNISYKNAKVGKAEHLCEVGEFVSMSVQFVRKKNTATFLVFFVCSVCVCVRVYVFVCMCSSVCVRVRVCVCELMS